jgi:hypothetical protein
MPSARVREPHGSVRPIDEHMFVSTTRESIARLLEEGYSAKAIADRLLLAGTTVSYHIEQLQFPSKPKRQRRPLPVGTARTWRAHESKSRSS